MGGRWSSGCVWQRCEKIHSRTWDPSSKFLLHLAFGCAGETKQCVCVCIQWEENESIALREVWRFSLTFSEFLSISYPECHLEGAGICHNHSYSDDIGLPRKSQQFHSNLEQSQLIKTDHLWSEHQNTIVKLVILWITLWEVGSSGKIELHLSLIKIEDKAFLSQSSQWNTQQGETCLLQMVGAHNRNPAKRRFLHCKI